MTRRIFAAAALVILLLCGAAAAPLAQEKAGENEAALARADSLAAIGSNDRYDLFRVAESYARAGEVERSLEYLRMSLDAGFINGQLMLEWSDALEPLRQRPEWEEIESALRRKIQEVEAGMPEELAPLRSVTLPEPSHDGGASVEKALKQRRSVRKYADEPLTTGICSQLLWAAYGITLTRDGMPDFVRGGLRTAPSAGARYPLELYLFVWKVDGLDDGIYHYSSRDHKLEMLAEGDFSDELAEACWGQNWLKGGAGAIVYSAVFERTTSKYGDRGRERYVCMDLGHSGENVYLQCGSLGLGTCAIGAFVDLELKQLTGMTKEEEPLYVMPFGRLK